MTFGANPTTGTQGALATNQFPISTVAEPGRASGDLTALEGGPGSVDSNSNRTAPVSMYVKDGSDVAQGTTTDVAWSGSGAATAIALLKKLVAELAATLAVNVSQVGGVATQMMTADGIAEANLPITGIGLYNNSGNVADRLRDGGSVGDTVTIGFIAAQTMLFNGGSSDRLRTPTTFIPIASVSITAASPVAVWTPAGGRKFHLMGYCVTSTVAASIIFKDGTTEILRVPVTAGVPQTNPGNFGNGYASGVSNQALNFDVTTTGIVSGYVFGTAEF
jgi:hypothetical protein